jgi:hypothetical protein
MHRRFADVAFAFALIVCAGDTLAQPTVSPAAPEVAATAIRFASVSEALSALKGADGNGTVVTHMDGWVVINEPMAGAQWSFTPASHAAHPAVVRRSVRRNADGALSVETVSLCEASDAACAQLLQDFATLNDRITQSVRARSRQGSAQR